MSKEGTPLTRREFGKAAIMGALIGGASTQFEENVEAKPGSKKEKEASCLRRYSSGSLEGMKLSNLYASYTGCEGEVGKEISVDFPKQLKAMWQKKASHASSHSLVQGMAKNIPDAYRHAFQEDHTERMTIQKYLGHIEKAIEGIRHTIDWTRVGALMHLESSELALLEQIANHVTAHDLLSYSLTELMPSPNGDVNVHILDFLLRNAGRRYVEEIPAMYDSKASFGPYQFTEYALFDTGTDQRGASVINHAVQKEKRIPGSVSKLRGDDHHKAAFLFLIHNIASLVKKLNEKEMKTLHDQWKVKKDQLVVFAATAHHMPKPAFQSARRWLDAGTKQSYAISCGPHLQKYAQKTEANLRVVGGISIDRL